jgi:hypothetical protein
MIPMNKEFIICIGLIAIGAGGWVANKRWDAYQAQKVVHDQRMAYLKLTQEKTSNAQEIRDKKLKETEAQFQKRQEQERAARPEIEAQLKGCKISSILLGNPSIVVINKKNYEEGADLPLPNGKALKIASIKEDRVMLASGTQTFQLVMPSARDLGGTSR